MRTAYLCGTLRVGVVSLLLLVPGALALPALATPNTSLDIGDGGVEVPETTTATDADVTTDVAADVEDAHASDAPAAPPWMLPGDAACDLSLAATAGALSCAALAPDATTDAGSLRLYPGVAYLGAWTLSTSTGTTTLDVLTFSAWAGAAAGAPVPACTSARCNGVRAMLDALDDGAVADKGLPALLLAASEGTWQAPAGPAGPTADVLLQLVARDRSAAFFDAQDGALYVQAGTSVRALPVAWDAPLPDADDPAWQAPLSDVPCAPMAWLSALDAGATTDACEAGGHALPLHLSVRLGASLEAAIPLAIDGEPLTDYDADEAGPVQTSDEATTSSNEAADTHGAGGHSQDDGDDAAEETPATESDGGGSAVGNFFRSLWRGIGRLFG